MTALTFALTIVRHGETQWNKDGLLQGQSVDSSLSEIGLQQAGAAGRYLKDVKFTNIFVSNMLRARQTAETIVQHNSSCSGLEMVTDHLLKERSFGIAEGRRVQEMRDMAEAAGLQLLDFTPPEGETPQQVKVRVKGFLENMLRRMVSDHRPQGSLAVEMSPVVGEADDGVRNVPAHALVVTHGAYIRVMLRCFMEELHCAPPQGSDEAHVMSLCPNTGICRFLFTVREEEEGGGVKVSAIRSVFVHRGSHVEEQA